MKKQILLVVIVLLGGLFTACQGGEGPEPSPPGDFRPGMEVETIISTMLWEVPGGASSNVMEGERFTVSLDEEWKHQDHSVSPHLYIKVEPSGWWIPAAALKIRDSPP